MRRAAIGYLWLGLTSLALAISPEYQHARLLYARTDYADALQVLLSIPKKDAPTWQLLGQAYFMQGDFKQATEYLEKAVAAAPGNSQAWHWLGRAYGRRAETSSFLTAPGYASKARQYFEKAVEVDPRNIEAVNDLFEYYLEAPGFLGGGLGRAAALAEHIRALDPAEYHYAQARLAEKRKEFQTAEQQLRLAAQLAPRQVGRIIDLAKFFAKQGRYNESDEAFHQAERIAPRDPKVLFERASAYIQAGRNLEMARQLLKQYLEAPLTPDDPPRSQAEQLLKRKTGG